MYGQAIELPEGELLYCTCDPAELLRAGLADRAVEPCPVHTPEAAPGALSLSALTDALRASFEADPGQAEAERAEADQRERDQYEYGRYSDWASSTRQLAADERDRAARDAEAELMTTGKIRPAAPTPLGDRAAAGELQELLNHEGNRS